MITKHNPGIIVVGKSRKRKTLKLLPFYLIFRNYPQDLSSWVMSRANIRGVGRRGQGMV